MTHWGDRIAEVRKESGFNRPDFGLRIGERDYVIQRWEMYGNEPLVHTALHVANRLGLRVDDLILDRPTSWGGEFTASTRVGRGETMWRANMIALAKVAGDRAALAREIMTTKNMVQSWIYRRSIPVLRTATDVSDMIGFGLHTILTVRIDAEEAVAHAKVMRRMRSRRRSPTPAARPVGRDARGHQQ